MRAWQPRPGWIRACGEPNQELRIGAFFASNSASLSTPAAFSSPSWASWALRAHWIAGWRRVGSGDWLALIDGGVTAWDCWASFSASAVADVFGLTRAPNLQPGARLQVAGKKFEVDLRRIDPLSGRDARVASATSAAESFQSSLSSIATSAQCTDATTSQLT